MGANIRSKLSLYKSYTKNSPLMINGKEDVITILDREDQSVRKFLIMYIHASKRYIYI